MDYYYVDGVTEFPVIGDDGGLQSSNLFYVCSRRNLLWRENASLASFLSNVAIPKYVT